MSEGFTVIEETVLAEARRVRLVPRQAPGRLALLRIREAEYCLVWSDERVAEAEHRIPLADLVAMVPDLGSSTLLLSTRSSGAHLFHFLRDTPETFVALLASRLPAL